MLSTSRIGQVLYLLKSTRIRTLAGPIHAKTKRQLAKVDVSSERQMYPSGRDNSPRKGPSSSHPFFARREKFLYAIFFYIMIPAAAFHV
jgi:hypothetical protein